MLKTSQIGERHEKDLSQVIPCPTPVMNRDLGKCSEEIDGACLKITRTERDVEAGNELWLDAHQFLAGEEDEGAIFDKWGRSCSPSPTLTHPDKTKASDYSRRENISIDHHTEDWELRFPPVERWSSSDSWASALSDWFQAVNTYSEDSFTSANTLSTGPKHGMAIQDNILEQRTSPDNANNTGQTCLNLLEPEEPGQALSRGLVESDNTNGTLLNKLIKMDFLLIQTQADRTIQRWKTTWVCWRGLNPINQMHPCMCLMHQDLLKMRPVPNFMELGKSLESFGVQRWDD